MADLTQVNQAIEGDKIRGHSRMPLKNRGLQQHNGNLVYRFVASFDVKSHIDKVLSLPNPQFEPNASISQQDKIVCQNALIHSSKSKYSSQVSKGSSTHKTNAWSFPQHTSVTITRSHQEIANAILKNKPRAKLT